MKMRVAAMAVSKSQRHTDLAIIHIARKDLQLDDDTYRDVIREIGGAQSGSSADLSQQGRSKVIRHFMSKGWSPKSKRRANVSKAPGMASSKQISYIRYLWIRLADNDVVKRRDEAGLRAWVQSASRLLTPDRAGYTAAEFLPVDAANKLIDQLKKWATRTGTEI